MLPVVAGGQASSSAKKYAKRIESIADSGYVVANGLADMMNRSILPTLANDSTKLGYRLDSAARLASTWTDAIRRHAANFDSQEPPADFARVHAQLVAALGELTVGMDSLSTALGYRSIRDRIEYTTRVVRGMTNVLEAQRRYEEARDRVIAIAKTKHIQISQLAPPFPKSAGKE